MVTMDDLSKAIILLVRVGAVARFIYCKMCIRDRENVENGTEHILPFTDYCSDEESACDLEDEEDMEL